MADEPILTAQERTISYILNSLSGVFQATKAGLHNVELFLYANPLEKELGKTLAPQDAVDLLGKAGAELVDIIDDGKVWLTRLRAFLQAAETEVVAAQATSAEAAKIAAAVKEMAANKGAEIVDQKPADLVKNPDGTVTVAAEVEEIKP